MNTTWVEASAGCGKTTLILNHYIEFQEKSLFISFSNASVYEFKDRLKVPTNIQCNTLHSLAYEFLKMHNKTLKISEKSLYNAALAELLKEDNFNFLYTWLLENNDLNFDIDLSSLDGFSIQEEVPLVIENDYNSLFNTAVILPEDFKKHEQQFFNKDGSEKKRLKIELSKSISNDLKEKFIIQLKKRALLHKKLYQKYILNIKKNVKNAIKNKEDNLKNQKNIVYYDDILIYCLDLIKSEPGLIFELLGNVKNIYIDETQDLSKPQFELIFAILQEWSIVGKNLLIVGDSKQIIYEFQGANLDNYNAFKSKILGISQSFEEKHMNITYRLPLKICSLLNNIGSDLDINYQPHISANKTDGKVDFVKISDYTDIIQYITNDTMILFKQKSEKIKDLAMNLMANGFFLNSPYIVNHPIISDFQYLLKWLIYKDQLSLGIISNIFYKNSMQYEDILKENDMMEFLESLDYSNLNQLFTKWINHSQIKDFLSNKLLNLKDSYIQILWKYCNFYKYDAYAAIFDLNYFYKNLSSNSGLFFNTIHASKGKESTTVILLNMDLDVKFQYDTNRLLYVALTRTKKELIVPFFNEKGRWFELCVAFRNA